MNKAFDEYFMRMALREAEKAAADGEVPTGCVIVDVAGLDENAEPTSARILARAHNMPEQLKDSTAHAEHLRLITFGLLRLHRSCTSAALDKVSIALYTIVGNLNSSSAMPFFLKNSR